MAEAKAHIYCSALYLVTRGPGGSVATQSAGLAAAAAPLLGSPGVQEPLKQETVSQGF